MKPTMDSFDSMRGMCVSLLLMKGIIIFYGLKCKENLKFVNISFPCQVYQPVEKSQGIRRKGKGKRDHKKSTRTNVS